MKTLPGRARYLNMQIGYIVGKEDYLQIKRIHFLIKKMKYSKTVLIRLINEFDKDSKQFI